MTTGAHNRLLLLGLDHMRSKDPPISLATASLAAACAPITEVDTLTLNTAACSGPDILHAVRHKCEGLPERAVVGIGAYIWAEALLNPIVAAVREASPKGTQIVLGGPQISDASEAEVHTFYPGVDHFARGSGEPILLRLLRGQAPDVRPAALSKEEVSSLPSPLLTGWMQPQAFLRWETQRGCPFACSFCQHPSAARKRRFIALDRVLAEAELLCGSSRSGVLKSLAVVDPTFNSGEHSIQVLRALTRGGFKARLSLQCRVEMLTDDFVSAVAELERTSQVTLEFGIQSIHRVEQRAVQRPTNMRKVIERRFRRHGASSHSTWVPSPFFSFAALLRALTTLPPCILHRRSLVGWSASIPTGFDTS